jgi:hypothetical protein
MTTPLGVVDELRTNAFASLEALLLKEQRSLQLRQTVRNASADPETEHPSYSSSTSAIVPGVESREPSASMQALPMDVPSSPSTLSPSPTKKQGDFDSGHVELHRHRRQQPLPTLPAPLGGTRQRQREAAITTLEKIEMDKKSACVRNAPHVDSLKPPEYSKRSESAAKIPPKSMAASR